MKEGHIRTNTKELRAAQGLKQYELANLADINKGRLSNIERGIYIPKIEEVERISNVLGEKILFYIEVEPREG